MISRRSQSRLAGQDFFERPFDTFYFFPDDPDRLLISGRVSQGRNALQSAAYLVVARPDEVQPRAPLLAVFVNATHELGRQPGKHHTEH